ncbi:MAG: hypothetical protein OJF59_000342 [Cytophagales bacterium]|jgi:formylglycine-generating enzyme required for sulfatase activity|nr:SUMF1/EgtB/PvdO family nonheme iron enzyme [Bacteroidota bacterium]MBS1981173.1 SUMF1/EgtB/PvdO family nonheme iron enzyme [Bacteroidota bacterium]WHZ06589.1 MAG: hypothetical protein OJF59_000342 [Cytophagales bacterium]
MKILPALWISILSISLSAQTPHQGFVAYDQPVPHSKLSFKMVPIQEGSFIWSNGKGAHKKIVISAFWMGAYEMSRDAFDVFYKDESVSQNNMVDAVTRPTAQYIDLTWGMGKEGGFPINSMSQLAALMYCRWLYAKTGIFYRLPTEAEWEYACRAGTSTGYYFGNDSSQLSKYAWYAHNAEGKYHKAGQKLPNAWGLYDMLGNVSEWTLDHYYADRFEQIRDQEKDPIAPKASMKYPKVLKGGSYQDKAQSLRINHRIKSDPSWNKRDPQIPKSKWWLTDAADVGFRVVRPLKQPTPEEVEEFFKKYLSK